MKWTFFRISTEQIEMVTLFSYGIQEILTVN